MVKQEKNFIPLTFIIIIINYNIAMRHAIEIKY